MNLPAVKKYYEALASGGGNVAKATILDEIIASKQKEVAANKILQPVQLLEQLPVYAEAEAKASANGTVLLVKFLSTAYNNT